MDILCLILFLSVAALWFFTNEYGTLLEVYAPTYAMRTRDFNILMFAGLAAALWFGRSGAVASALQSSVSSLSLDCGAVMIILLSALIVLMALKASGIRGTVIYALLGAIGAYGLVSGCGFIFSWRYLLSLAVAPVMSFVFAFLLRSFFKLLLSKIQVHMIMMSYYMRMVVILCVILTICALGLNWGGLLHGTGGMLADKSTASVCVTGVVAAVMLLFMQFDKVGMDELSGVFADFSIWAVVSVGFSASAAMLFFSFDATTSVLGLQPVPLSVSSLAFSAIAGVEVAQRGRLVSDAGYVKEGVSFLAVPICTFVLAYLLFYMTGGESADGMVNFLVMAAAILILLALAFAGYVHRQMVQKEATERLVYSQQQQIYEHSRALNDMELKVVLSENQALHNAVEMKKQEVMNVALSIVEQREYLESLDAIVKELSKSKDEQERERLISELGSSLKQRLSYDRDVDSQYFYAQAESLHEDFSAKLAENFPALTQQERRLATLLRLGFSSKYIATLMNITPKSVEISRYRLRQKLGLSKGDNLVNFIKSI